HQLELVRLGPPMAGHSRSIEESNAANRIHWRNSIPLGRSGSQARRSKARMINRWRAGAVAICTALLGIRAGLCNPGPPATLTVPAVRSPPLTARPPPHGGGAHPPQPPPGPLPRCSPVPDPAPPPPPCPGGAPTSNRDSLLRSPAAGKYHSPADGQPRRLSPC